MRETAVVKGEFMEAITVVKRQITQLVHCSPSSFLHYHHTNQLMAFGIWNEGSKPQLWLFVLDFVLSLEQAISGYSYIRTSLTNNWMGTTSLKNETLEVGSKVWD